jgi:hypothetical protein
MRTVSRNPQRAFLAEDYFERKSRELIVPEDEIEAWELDSQDLSHLGADVLIEGGGIE